MRKCIFALLLFILPALGQTNLTTTQIAKRVAQSVVVIQGKTDRGERLGSGFIISKDGKVVTNLHVIRDLKSATVQLANGEIFDSISILATDERRDLAIVHVAGFDLPALELGNSNAVKVGEPVVIVGSPRGLQGTVTAGVLSSVRDSGGGFKVLQTDASVNPGNSGGPLVNGKGEAIGVIAFKLQSSENLNFAIPINYVSGLLNELHEPMSLGKTRTSSERPNSAEQSVGPSLRETLDWLQQKIPLAAAHYVFDLTGTGFAASGGNWKDVTQTTTPIRFDSCTVVFETKEASIWEKFPKSSPGEDTSRFTVPLGDLTGVEVKKDSIPLSRSASERLDTWPLILETTPSKSVLQETRNSVNNTSTTEASYVAVLIFYEEPLARRVSEAFKHAADLCRGKEPF